MLRRLPLNRAGRGALMRSKLSILVVTLSFLATVSLANAEVAPPRNGSAPVKVAVEAKIASTDAPRSCAR
jgi:hypothetical protein